MNIRAALLPAVFGFAVAACDREAQELPFSSGDGAVSRTVPSTGGTVSTPAGAAVHFPAGSLPSSTSVTLTPTTPPGEAARSGSVVAQAFRLEPAGLALDRAAQVELRFQTQRRDSAWLASLVNLTPQATQERADTRVDLTTGLVVSRITRLGTLTVVIPERSAIFPVTRRTAAARIPGELRPALLSHGTDSAVVSCGDPNNRCANLSVQASGNLLNKVEAAAAIYPLIHGTLNLTGARPTGQIQLSTSFRALLRSGNTAENVDIVAVIQPTASSTISETSTHITLTDMLFRVSGSAGSGGDTREVTGPLVLSKTSPTLTITRQFRIEGSSSALEDAFIDVTFPVQLHPQGGA